MKKENGLPILIDFEGLDCSFKETNSKLLKEHLGNSSKLYSFPQYGKPSCYFIEKYLHGDYPNMNPQATMEMFMLEMYDVWKTQMIPDFLDNGIKYVILDRYWYSNLYYQTQTSKDEETIINLANKFGLPKCDIIIKLLPDKQIMMDFVKRKKNKDILESDLNRLSTIYDKFKTYKFPELTATVNTTTTKNNKTIVRTKNQIFNDVLKVLKENTIIEG